MLQSSLPPHCHMIVKYQDGEEILVAIYPLNALMAGPPHLLSLFFISLLLSGHIPLIQMTSQCPRYKFELDG